MSLLILTSFLRQGQAQISYVTPSHGHFVAKNKPVVQPISYPMSNAKPPNAPIYRAPIPAPAFQTPAPPVPSSDLADVSLPIQITIARVLLPVSLSIAKYNTTACYAWQEFDPASSEPRIYYICDERRITRTRLSDPPGHEVSRYTNPGIVHLLSHEYQRGIFEAGRKHPGRNRVSTANRIGNGAGYSPGSKTTIACC